MDTLLTWSFERPWAGVGTGTVAVNPDNGAILWNSQVVADHPDFNLGLLARIEHRWKDYPDLTEKWRSYAKRLFAPYPAYAPVVWKDYVIDGAMYAHDDFISQIWCLQVGSGQPVVRWQNGDTIPECHPAKSNMIAKDERLYLFDQNAYAPRGLKNDEHGKPIDLMKARSFRGKDVGQFQCYDIASGKRLWHTNAFRLPNLAGADYDPTDHYQFIMAGDLMILHGGNGAWIARAKDDGVEVLAQCVHNVPKDASVSWINDNISMPMLAGQRLYLRFVTSESGTGYNKIFGGQGNLVCLDLTP